MAGEVLGLCLIWLEDDTGSALGSGMAASSLGQEVIAGEGREKMARS